MGAEVTEDEPPGRQERQGIGEASIQVVALGPDPPDLLT
jgi:hypothetical protein